MIIIKHNPEHKEVVKTLVEEIKKELGVDRVVLLEHISFELDIIKL